jgi:hypothetical protein
MGPVEAILSSRPAVATGDLSYSLYLWHWPAIVLARAAFGEGAIVVGAAVLGSFALAWLSKLHVEDRFRADPRLSGAGAVRLVVTCVTVPLGIALVVGAVNDRVADGIGLGPDSRPWGIGECLVPRRSEMPWPRDECLRGGDGVPAARDVDVLLIGDSHATSLSEGLLVAADRLGLSLGIWAVEGQPPIGDGPWTQRFRDLIAQERPFVVVVANRSRNNLDPENLARWTGLPVDGQEAADLWERIVRRDVTGYRDLGPRVIWVLNVPEFPGGPIDEGAVPTLARPKVVVRSITREQLGDLRGPAIPAEIRALSDLPGVTIIDPADVLCDPDCRNAIDGAHLYYDSHHLTVVGSRLLAAAFEDALRAALVD